MARISMANMAIGWVAGAVLLWGLVGCTKTAQTGGGSGETHFLATCEAGCDDGLSCVCGVCTRSCDAGALACDTDAAGAVCRDACPDAPSRVCDVACEADADCASLSSRHRCQAGYCRASASVSEADAAMPDTAVTPDASAPSDGCDAHCVPVLGHPVDMARECVDLRGEQASAQAAPVDCSCNPDTRPAPLECHRRVSDGSVWVFSHAGTLAEPQQWEDCDAAQQAASEFACDYVACARPPRSTCAPTAFCQNLGCDTVALDAAGCLRPACADDTDCQDDERCTLELCTAEALLCTQLSSGDCRCAGPNACPSEQVCAPLRLAGPRGDWVSIRITENASLCSSPDGCLQFWSVGADGRYEANIGTEGRSGMLTEGERQLLGRMLDGGPLRVAMRDGIDCGPPPLDAGSSATLELTTGTLEQDIGACVYPMAPANEFSALKSLLQQLTQ